jgi:membrane protein
MHVDPKRTQTPLRTRRARPRALASRHVSFTDALHAIDRRQQRTRGVRFVAAVYKKFSDDQAGQLAALVSYYAFISIFPLLLVFVTLLGFVLQDHPADREKIVHGTLGQFPILSERLTLHSLKGSGVALAVGIVGTLLSGMGVTSAAQHAFNRIWGVPFKSRPNFIFMRVRSLGMLAVLGTLMVVSTTAAGFVGSSSHAALAVVAGIVIAFAVNVILFLTAFKLLTAADLGWRPLLPGVLVASVLWQLLQHLGGYYIDHALKHTQPLYGTFALVLGLLAWLFLGSQLVIFAAEINVVRTRRLWPRSFFSEPLLDADKRALTSSAEVEERVQQESVEVSFDEEARR